MRVLFFFPFGFYLKCKSIESRKWHKEQSPGTKAQVLSPSQSFIMFSLHSALTSFFFFGLIFILRTWVFLVFLSLVFLKNLQHYKKHFTASFQFHSSFSLSSLWTLSSSAKYYHLPTDWGNTQIVLHRLGKYTGGGKHSFWRIDIFRRIYIT